jgi:hypothetical protein
MVAPVIPGGCGTPGVLTSRLPPGPEPRSCRPTPDVTVGADPEQVVHWPGRGQPIWKSR